jgi:outer membrane protein
MIKKILLTTVCLVILTGSVGAARKRVTQLKIAVVDMDHLFLEYYKTKETDAVLKQKKGIYEAWTKKLNEACLKLEKEFNVLRDAAQNIALAGVEREKKRKAAEEKYQELKKKQTELTQYIQQKTTEYKNLVTKRHRELLEEIYNEIRQYAVLKGYDFVFDKSGKTLNTIPMLIYSSQQHDITSVILDKLNRGQPDVDSQKDKNSSLR